MSYSTIKPVPYYSTTTTYGEQVLAKALRAEFLPMVKRLLPYHHLCGWKHDNLIEFVKKHSSKYRYFLRTDIKKFYPSINHRDLCVGVQIAYRDLLNLDYVPKNFKDTYLRPLVDWTVGLPLDHSGIPLSSPMSAIAAPLMLVPIWLHIKRRWKIAIKRMKGKEQLIATIEALSAKMTEAIAIQRKQLHHLKIFTASL